MTDKLHPHQQKLVELLADLESQGLSPTGRRRIPIDNVCDSVISGESYDEQSRAACRALMFVEHYGSVHDSFVFPLEMSFANLEKRMIATGLYPTPRMDDFIYDEIYRKAIPKWEYQVPTKDFVKARTKKEKLEAQLPKAPEVKPSSLLSRLVNKG